MKRTFLQHYFLNIEAGYRRPLSASFANLPVCESADVPRSESLHCDNATGTTASIRALPLIETSQLGRFDYQTHITYRSTPHPSLGTLYIQHSLTLCVRTAPSHWLVTGPLSTGPGMLPSCPVFARSMVYGYTTVAGLTRGAPLLGSLDEKLDIELSSYIKATQAICLLILIFLVWSHQKLLHTNLKLNKGGLALESPASQPATSQTHSSTKQLSAFHYFSKWYLYLSLVAHHDSVCPFLLAFGVAPPHSIYAQEVFRCSNIVATQLPTNSSGVCTVQNLERI